MIDGLRLGAELMSGGVRFCVYTTTAASCAVRLYEAATPSLTRVMTPVGEGVFATTVEGIGPGTRYMFLLDGRELPDPYARFLPAGVHAPAMVMQSGYAWKSGYPRRRGLSEHIIYELHVGTFSEEGTFAGAQAHLCDLANLGVTAIELMPVTAFAGNRGWGYDSVALYAPHSAYGEPDDLRAFVDEAHSWNLCVFLDVVYNHFGPAGNYLAAYSQDYFTSEVRTPWGEAPNFSNAFMRNYVVDNARYWFDEFHFDGLRLDAVHTIVDHSSRHVLRAVSDVAAGAVPPRILVGEDDRKDLSIATDQGMHGVWVNDFHHQVRVCLTDERDGYFASYRPGAANLARVINRGYSTQTVVYYIQNHDQVGNRAFGTRLSADVSCDAYCAVSSLLLFLPMTPLLFMGQEWAASNPFLFFTDHDPELGARVTEGRRAAFHFFAAFSDLTMREKIPDPQDKRTFSMSKLNWSERQTMPHARVYSLYRKWLWLRRNDPVLRHSRLQCIDATANEEVLVVKRWFGDDVRTLIVNFDARSISLNRIDSAADQTQRLEWCSDNFDEDSTLLRPFAAILLASTRRDLQCRR